MSAKILHSYLKVADSRPVDILLWILRQKDDQDRLYTTLEHAAKQCKVTKVTVNRIFQKLYKAGFMTKIRNGQYQLHLNEKKL